MNLPPTSFEQAFVDYTTSLCPETIDFSVQNSGDQFQVATNIARSPPHTTSRPDAQHIFDNIDGVNVQQSCELLIPRANSQPKQTKPNPPAAKAACLRCRGKKSRCSGQQPCGGCTNDGLECLWDDESKLRPKRNTRTPRAVQAAETGRGVSKAKPGIVQVRSACTRCQHRKAKCSGTRPVCAYCSERQLDCSYTVAEGTTRTDDLKRRLRESSNKAQAFGVILSVMRQGTDEQATTVLARLRIGETLRDIVCSLPTSASSPTSEFQTELNRRLSAA